MKIIKSGIAKEPTYKRECRCGCIFEFTKNELEKETYKNREWSGNWCIFCPECKNKIII